MENDTESYSLDVRSGRLIVAIYLQAAQRNFDEAEELAERALQLREAGMALLDRAKVVAIEAARTEP